MLFSDNISYLSGYLLTWPQGPIEKTHLLRCKKLEFVGDVASSHWEELHYISPVPLYREDSDVGAGPYEYTIVCRRSGPRVLLLSEHAEIIEYLLAKDLKDIF